MQPKSPRFFGLGRPRLDVVDGGKVVSESDRMSESLAETQAGGPLPSQADRLEAVSLAETQSPGRKGVRTGGDRIRSGESLAKTRIASGELDDAPASEGEGGSAGLMKTMLATGEEKTPSLRSRSGDRVEVGLARTMDGSDPLIAAASSPAMDADLIGLAKTHVRGESEDGGAPSRPSLRRDEAITDEPDLERRVLQADAEDRRLKEMIRARLFRKKAAPVKIGRFTILDRLGEGGMGVVYTAYDDQLDRKVAIKVMRSEGGEDTLGSARLQREAQAMARLSHPNIVTVHEVNQHEGQIYVAMEYIRGQSLDRWLQEPRPLTEVLEVFRQAGRGLDAAHRAGLVHRDFKPHNVLLGDDGVVKVLDFGLVRASGVAEAPESTALATIPAETQALSLLDASLTRTGAIMGTPAYMAPEQHKGLVATAKSDLFSFCVALYEGLYGDHPYECTTLVKLTEAVARGQIKEPPAGAKVPAWLRKVVLRGLAVDPERRPASMHELLVELARDPVARRRRIFAGAGAAALVGAIGFGIASASAPAIAACTGAAEEIAAVWDDAKKDAVKAAILGAGVAYAGETWEKVAPRLDAYAGEWAAMRTEACESHREQRHSDRLFDLRTACLDQRRAGLVGLVEVLSSADAGVVENAVKAASSLPPIATCGDTEALTSAVPPPEDPEVAAKVQELREGLARARAAEELGKYTDALRIAAPLVAEARALDYAPALGEALLRQGSVEMAAGMADAADLSLTSALTTAFAAGDDPVALEAVSKRIFVVAYQRSDTSRAATDLPWTAALLERTGSPPAARALFLNNSSVIFDLEGDLSRAEANLKDALAAATAAYGPEHPELIAPLTNLGLLRSRSGDYQAAVEALTDAEALAIRTLGRGHPSAGQLSVTLALALVGVGDLERAHTTMASGLASTLPSLDASSPVRAMTLTFAAIVDVERRDLPSATSRLEEVLAMTADPNAAAAPLRPLAQEWLGTASALAGEHGRAHELHARAIAGVQTSNTDDPMALADALDSFGTSLARAGDRDAAIARHREALAVRREKLPPKTASLAISLEHLGALLTDTGDLGGAAAALDEAAQIVAEALPPGSQQQAKILRSQGALALARGDAGAATSRAREALAIHEASRDAGDGELALTRLALARALRAAGELEEAKALARAALEALKAGGPGWSREAAEAEAFLAGR